METFVRFVVLACALAWLGACGSAGGASGGGGGYAYGGNAFAAGYQHCNQDSDCPGTLVCDPEAVSVGDGYCTAACELSTSCTQRYACPGLGPKSGKCEDLGNHKGHGYCDQFSGMYGPNLCLKVQVDAGATATADAAFPGTDGGGGCAPGTCSTTCACANGDKCVTGKCVKASVCGDGTCASDETKTSCCSDCGCTAPATCTGNKCVQPAQHNVQCGSTGIHAVWLPYCTCDGDSNPGTAKFSGESCSLAAGSTSLKKVCCADSGFPGAGDCECHYYGDWICLSFNSSSCSCSFQSSTSVFWAASDVTKVCDAVAAPGGAPWRCCADPLGTCACAQTTAACTGKSKKVNDCTAWQPLGFTKSSGTCAAGKTNVKSCYGSSTPTGGGGCKSSADCPGECSGDSVMCCPSCKTASSGNYCGQMCCNASGSCF